MRNKISNQYSKTPYNLQFVLKIKQSKKQVEEGKFITLDPGKSLWENLESPYQDK